MRKLVPKGFDILGLSRACNVHVSSIYRALNRFDERTGVHICSPDLAVEIHRHSLGLGALIPCWELRPDLWAEGQVPPSLTDLRAAS